MEPYVGNRLGYRRAKDGEASCSACKKCAGPENSRLLFCHVAVDTRYPWAREKAWLADSASAQQVAAKGKRCDMFEAREQ